jgi:hypothetical protein
MIDRVTERPSPTPPVLGSRALPISQVGDGSDHGRLAGTID